MEQNSANYLALSCGKRNKKQTNNKKTKQNRNTPNFSQDTKLQKHSQENNYLLNSKTRISPETAI